MARRTDPARYDVNTARKQAVANIRRLTANSGVNYAQFEAQVHEAKMVRLLVGLAEDVLLPPDLRRECAIDVITLARGKIGVWLHDGQTIDPEAPSGVVPGTVGQEIEQVRIASEAYEELDELIRKRVPPAYWPERIRTLAGEAVVQAHSGEGPVLVDMTGPAE